MSERINVAEFLEEDAPQKIVKVKSGSIQTVTERVAVKNSDLVAEIVGRKGWKVKALRAATNTYIQSPARGDEPVFVVRGRKEDVAMAKTEILGLAEYFYTLRANLPYQALITVPKGSVGFVVGPKGAVIKRIQQRTYTHILTPFRDMEPVFTVSGLPENIEAAHREIGANVAEWARRACHPQPDEARGPPVGFNDLPE